MSFKKGRESDIMKLKSLAVLSMSAVVLTACGNDTPKDETKSTESNTNQDANTTKDVIALKDVKTSPEDAVKKAEETYKGQKLKGISFENSNGEWAYKVTQQKSGEESEVLVADKNKKVINKKTEKEDTVNENDNFKYSDAIDYKKAIKEGQKEFDGDIKEWSLEKDDGKLVYNIDLKKVIKNKKLLLMLKTVKY